LRRHAYELELRQRRPPLRVAEVRPEDVADLDERIRGELHLRAERAVLRLRRDLEALPVGPVLPAVVSAADAALSHVPEPQRGPAVWAELVDQAVLAVARAERDQTLGQQLDPNGRRVVLRQLLDEERGEPVAAEELARRRARAGAREELVDLLLQHVRRPV